MSSAGGTIAGAGWAQRQRIVLGLAIAATVILFDQLTKLWVLDYFDLAAYTPPPPNAAGAPDYGSRPGFAVLPFFEINLVWNRGISFGLFAADTIGQRLLLVGVALAVVGGVSVWLTRAESALTAAAIGFVIGGAVGNVIDRLTYAAVVDFLDFSGLGFPWVFNIADAAINVAVGLLLLDLIWPKRDNR